MKNTTIPLRHKTSRILAGSIAAFLTMQAAHAANGVWTQTTTGGIWSDTANWSGGTVADNGTADFNTINITADNTVHLDSARTISTLTFGDTATSSAASWILDNNGNAANTLTGISTITVNALGTDKTATISAAIVGAEVQINTSGVGTLVLAGANTFTKTSNNSSYAIRLNSGGTVVIASDSAFGVTTGTGFLATTVVNLNGAALQASGSDRTVANPIWLNASTTVVSGSQSLTFSGTASGRAGSATVTNNITGVGKTLSLTGNVYTDATTGFQTLTFNGTGNTLISGVIANNTAGTVTLGKITKSGTGTLTLSNANTYSGVTTLQGGGTTVLDYGTSDFSKFSDTAALILGGATGGGTLTLKGATGSHVEVVSATTLNAGGTFLTRDVNGGANTTKLRMNAITRAAGGTISFGDATLADTNTNNFGASGVNAILGGWATLGNDWAVSVNTGAANTTITALASYTTFLNNVGSSTANYLLNGVDALGGATAVGTLKITNSGNSQTLNLGSNDLTVTSASATALGGIMYAGGTGSENLYTIGNGGGTGRIVSSTGNQELIFAVQTGTLSVSAFVGLSSASSPVTKSGAGTMEISSNNNFTGAVRVNQGVLRLANANATGTNGGGITVQNGAALELTGGLTFIDDALTITGGGVSSGGALKNVSGANIYQGAITIGNGGARINNADTVNALTVRGITTAVNADVTFGGAGNITHNTTAISGAGGLIKDGLGTTTLSVTNGYTGATTVNEGTLLVSGSISGSASTVSNAGSTLGGTGIVGAVTVNSGAILQGGDGLSASDDLSSGGNVSLNNGSIIKLTLGAANAHSSLTRTAGTWAFDNDQAFTFIGTQAGTFDNIIAGLAGTETNLITGGSTAWNFSDVNWNYTFTYDGGMGAGNVDLTIITVPEPGAAVSLLGGLGLLLGVRRRRTRKMRQLTGF